MLTIAGGVVIGVLVLFVLAVLAKLAMALIDFLGEERSLKKLRRQHQEQAAERAEFVQGLIHQHPPHP